MHNITFLRRGTGLLKGFRVLGEDRVKVNTCQMLNAGLERKLCEKGEMMNVQKKLAQ